MKESLVGNEPSWQSVVTFLWIFIHVCAILVAALVRDEKDESKKEARIRLSAMVLGPAVVLVLLGMQVNSIYRNAFPKKDPSLPKVRVIRP